MTRFPQAELPPELPIHNNLVRAFYANPAMFKDFGRLAMKVHSASRITTRVRELAILRIAAKLGAAYEWANHVPGAQAAGISDDELRALRSGDLSIFTGADLAAVRYADAVDDHAVDEAAWTAVSAHFTTDEIFDLTMAIGFYGFGSRMVLALDVPIDEGLRGFEHP
jgi:alkylhydroperoxidase family enzyme